MADQRDIAAISLSEYERRRTTAERKIAAGLIQPEAARRELRAWAAIAVLCDASLFDLQIAEYRKTIVHYAGDGSPAVYGHLLPEHEARGDLARDLCPRDYWRSTLSRSRDAALARADNPERIDRARNLCILARALNVPLTAASCVQPGQPERKAA